MHFGLSCKASPQWNDNIQGTVTQDTTALGNSENLTLVPDMLGSWVHAVVQQPPYRIPGFSFNPHIGLGSNNSDLMYQKLQGYITERPTILSFYVV